MGVLDDFTMTSAASCIDIAFLRALGGVCDNDDEGVGAENILHVVSSIIHWLQA